jgi:hypothetical protein
MLESFAEIVPLLPPRISTRLFGGNCQIRRLDAKLALGRAYANAALH